MATLALAAAGAAIGNAAITGTVLGLSGAAWGWMIGTTLGSYLFAPTYRSEGPRLSDMKISGGGYGVGIPHVYGAARVNGNVIWASELIETTTTEEVGGKGGGGTEVTTYSYSANIAVGVCEGPVDCIRRIWANGKLIYDVTNTVGQVDDQVISPQNIAIYLGGETQTADPVMQAALGAANVPAYRGLAYVVFEGLQLEKFGNRIPKFDFEIGSGGIINAAWDYVSEGLVTSPDLVNWSPSFPATATETVMGVLSNDNDTFSAWIEYFQASPYESGVRFYRSTDGGQTWVEGETEASWSTNDTKYFSYECRNWIYHDSKYILVTRADDPIGTDGQYMNVLTSTDGLNYSRAGNVMRTGSVNANDKTLDFFYSPLLGKYVGLATDGSSNWFYSGTTLTNLTEVYDATWSLATVASLVEFKNKFYFATVNNSGVVKVYESADLINWAEVYSVPETANSLYYVYLIANSQKLIINYCGYDDGEASFYCGVRSSTDGQNWSDRITLEFYEPSTIVAPRWNGQHFICADIYNTPGQNRVWFSSNGQDWTTYDPGAEFNQGLDRFAFIGSACGTGALPLSTTVGSICAHVGLGANDIDTSAIQSISVSGYVVANQMTARAAIEPLLAAYNVDAYESDGKVVFLPKLDGYVGEAIGTDALGASLSDESFEDYVRISRTQTLELPNEVVVRYVDRDLDYDANQQYARRIAGSSEHVLTLEMPLVLTATEAAQLANNVLYRAWSQRDEFSFSTTHRYSAYEPTDIVFVPYGGENRRVRIVKKEESGALINWSGVSEDLSVYQQIATGAAGGGTTPAIITRAETDLMVFETPVLRDQDDYLQLTVLAGGTTPDPWPGGALYIVGKDAQALQVALGPLPARAITGRLLTDLDPVSDPISADFDLVSTFDVQVPWGTLESRTSEEVLAGFNTCVIQRADGTVEVLGFQTATLTAPGQYTLSSLLRRIRQNSSFSGASAGDKFALLKQSTTKLIGMQLQDVGAEFEFAGPRYGLALSEAATQLITLTGMSKKPLSPIEVVGSRDGSGNLEISWTRRTRIGGSWATGENGPVSEAAEAYEVDIYSNASPPTVLRTLTSASPTVTYAIADQITDFGSPAPASVDVVVYQLSAFIGRGYPAAATV